MIYVLRIKQNQIPLIDIEKYLKTTFKSYDYMTGFCDGYLFDNYNIMTLQEFETQLNTKFNDMFYIKFITVNEN